MAWTSMPTQNHQILVVNDRWKDYILQAQRTEAKLNEKKNSIENKFNHLFSFLWNDFNLFHKPSLPGEANVPGMSVVAGKWE